MVADVTVITPAIAQRSAMLAECIESVRTQTTVPAAHFIGIDNNKIGAGAICNELIRGVRTTYVAFLADDDIFYPNHIETLEYNAKLCEADLVYSWCDVVGRGAWNPNATFDAERLRTGNYIPSTVLIRTDTFRELGGFNTTPFIAEDWDLWIRMVDAGKKFICIPTITWQYRFHGANISDGWIPE